MVRGVLYDLYKQCIYQISQARTAMANICRGINPSDDIDDDVCIDVHILPQQIYVYQWEKP